VRNTCDWCRDPFTEGKAIFRYIMTGSAAEFDGVDGEKAALHPSCAVSVVEIITQGSQRDTMHVAHRLAMSIRQGS
jgi:hypothetical protein